MAEPLTLRIRIVKTNTLKMMQVRGGVGVRVRRGVWDEGECGTIVGLMDVR